MKNKRMGEGFGGPAHGVFGTSELAQGREGELSERYDDQFAEGDPGRCAFCDGVNLQDMPPGFVLLRLPRPNRWDDGSPEGEPWVAAIACAGQAGDYVCCGLHFIDTPLEVAASGPTPVEAVERLRAKLKEGG